MGCDLRRAAAGIGIQDRRVRAYARAFPRAPLPSTEANPSQIMQKLEDRTALFILRNLRENLGFPWCQKMLARVTLPVTVHHHAHFRVWQRKFYDMNIWTAKKREEKLNYMHNNPVKRGLVRQPGDWPWSSWRFYFLNDISLLPMDRVP